MTLHDPRVSVSQMLGFAEEAVALGRGKSADEIDEDRLLWLGLTRLIELVGEAANRLPAELRQAHPEVPLRDIIDMRNVLVHGYDLTSTEVLADVISTDLPELVSMLEQLLASLETTGLSSPPANPS